MTSDEELRGNFTIQVIEDDIIFVEWFRDLPDPADNVRQAQLAEEGFQKIFDIDPNRKYHFLSDLTPIGNITHRFPRDSRKIYMDTINHPQIDKIAVGVANVLFKILISFVTAATSKGDKVKFFTTVAEAKAWLREA